MCLLIAKQSLSKESYFRSAQFSLNATPSPHVSASGLFTVSVSQYGTWNCFKSPHRCFPFWLRALSGNSSQGCFIGNNVPQTLCLPPSLLSLCICTSMSREVRIRVPFLSVVYFSRGTLPKKGYKGTTGGPRCLKRNPFEPSFPLQPPA